MPLNTATVTGTTNAAGAPTKIDARHAISAKRTSQTMTVGIGWWTRRAGSGDIASNHQCGADRGEDETVGREQQRTAPHRQETAVGGGGCG